MYITDSSSEKKNFWLSWEFLLVKLMIFGLITVSLEKPVGSLSGQIALEQKGFNISSYNMREQKVYAVATGPRGDNSIERGVWVNNDGTFRLDQLPVGEYNLKVRATGFGTEYQEGLFVEEGKVAEIPEQIEMHLIEPSVSVATNVRVFTTKEKPHFWINATGATEATVRLYKQDFLGAIKEGKFKEMGMEVNYNFDVYRSYDAKFHNPFASRKVKPIKEYVRKLEQDDQDSSRVDFEVDNNIEPGDYIALAEVKAINSNKRAQSATWFTITDMGLVIKHAPDHTLVRAVDLNTLKPMPGATIKVVEKNGDTYGDLGAAKTGKDGFATIKLTKAQKEKLNYDVVLFGALGAHKAYGGLSFWRSESDRRQTYFYTDRPVYRLGQTVYYKGITRYLDDKGFRNPGKNVPLDIAVEDPDNQKIWTAQLRTSAHGTFHGVFEIPAEGKTGAYQLIITYPDGGTSYEAFEVAQYRKPEYLVEVKPLEQRVTAGSKVKAMVQAKYFFGGPVANAKVKYSVYASTDWSTRYRLMPRPDYYSYFDDWDGDSESEGYYEYGGDYLAEGYAQTDANGQAIIEVDSKPQQIDTTSSPYVHSNSDQRYKFETEVTDISRLTVTGSGSTLVTAGDFTLFANPLSDVCKVGEPIPVEIQATDYDGKPVANQSIDVRLSRWAYDRIKSEYRPEEVHDKTTVTTGATGKATLTFNTKDSWPTDTFHIIAASKDKHGNDIATSDSVWIASEKYEYVRDNEEAQQEPLTIKLDKPVYQPGDVAKAMITAPLTGKEGAEAIVSIEGTTIHKMQIIPMSATAKYVEIPIEKWYSPNAFVSVAIVGPKHTFHTSEEMIKVSPENHFVKVDIQTDKKKYKPGETVKYTIKASHKDGTPLSGAELSLGVVDESIYSIRPETAGDIRKFFYRRRQNWVSTACSFPETYSGGPDKIEPKVRKDFKDTAAWLPQLITNNDGIATAEVKLPDNLTTWRATVRCVDTGTDVGASIQKIVSTQDLILRLAMPRFFTQGDHGAISAIVHNYSDVKQSVNLTLSVSSNFKVETAMNQHVDIDPEKAQRVSWPVDITTPGSGVVSVKAIGSTAGDAMQVKIPLNPLGVVTFASKSGVLTSADKSVDLPFGMSGDAQPGTARASLSLAASSLGPVVGNFTSLIEYPYGCTEQTMSRLVPSIVAIHMNKRWGAPLTAKDKKLFDATYKEGMRKLREYHHEDGGWGWWVEDDSVPFLTSYVLEGFHMLKQVGYSPDQNLIDTGRAWLEKATVDLHTQLTDPKRAKPKYYDYADHERKIDMARMAYAMSLYKTKLNPKVKAWFLSTNKYMTPEALSYLTLAFHNMGDEPSAKHFYSLLISLANKSVDYTDWDHTPDMTRRLKVFNISDTGYDYSYRFTGVESTALALKAILAMEAENSALVESTKRWLLLQRGKDGWDNTKTTAQVFLALLEEELINNKGGAEPISVQALVGSSPLASLTFDKSNRFAPEKQFALPISGTPSKVTITKEGDGRLFYTSLLTYFRKLQPNDNIAAKALPRDLHISRKFFRLETVATKSDGTLKFRTKEITDGKIRAGETILMKCYVDAPVALPYVIVDVGLPSGGEVVEDSHKAEEAEGENGENLIEGDWGAPWWTHQDVLDDRIVFFGSEIPAGKSEFHTLLRMELPGTLQMNPITLEGMYTKGIRAFSQMNTLSVSE